MSFPFDPALAVLSLVVAVIGTWTALALTSRLDPNSSPALERTMICMNTAIVLGTSLWAMQAIALLALRLPQPVGYGLVETLASIFLAVIATGAALGISSRRAVGAASLPLAIAVLAGALAGSSLLAVSGLTGAAATITAPAVAATVAGTAVAAGCVLAMAFSRLGMLPRVLLGSFAAAIFVVAHVAAIGLSQITIDARVVLSSPILPSTPLAYMLGAAAVLIAVTHLALQASLEPAPRRHRR